MRSVIVLFGKKISSLNIIGKAGGLLGLKGEILIS